MPVSRRQFARLIMQCWLIAAVVLMAPGPVGANEAEQEFDLPAQPLGQSLQQLAERFDLKIAFYSEVTNGLQAPALKGTFTQTQAFDALLADTPLEYVYVVQTTVAIRPRASNLTEGELTMNQNKISPRPSLFRRLGTTLATALFATSAASAAAENADTTEADKGYIEEIVVTATHRETNLMDTPSGISAISEQMIQELGAESATDLFQHIAGLNFSSEEVGASRYVVRGVSSQVGANQQKNTFSTIGVYFDNTPVTSALGPQGQTNGALFDMNRVEVLKGPQGTLFGEGSQGGNVRYIFNQPNPSELTAAINVSGAALDESDDTSHRIDAVVNIPLIQDVLAVRVLAFDTETAGFVDLVTPGSTIKDYNPTGIKGGRLAFRYAPNDTLEVTASAYVSDSKSEGLPLVFRPYEAQTPVYPGLETRSRDEVDIYDLTVNVDLGWATLTSITSQFDREAQSVTGLPSFLLSILDRFLLAPQLTTQITLGNWPAVGPTGFPPSDGMNIVGGGFNHLTQTDRFIQEFRLVSPSDQPLRWTAGIFYKSSKDSINVGIPVIVHPDRPYLQEPFDLIFDTPVNKYANELKELAVYGEVNYDMSETVEITLGARISKPEQKIIPAGGTSVFTETPLGDLDLE